jgi:hypothetical protein
MLIGAAVGMLVDLPLPCQVENQRRDREVSGLRRAVARLTHRLAVETLLIEAAGTPAGSYELRFLPNDMYGTPLAVAPVTVI